MKGWTNERIATLKRMWTDSSNSFAKIGEVLGVSRDAVAGMRRRLNLPERRSGGRSRKKAETLVAEPKAKKFTGKRFLIPPSKRALLKPETKPKVAMDAPEPRMLDLLDLTQRTCKWPVTDYAPIKFCGHEKESGVPYCDYHQARASARTMNS